MLRNIREVTGTLPDSYETFLDAPIPTAERFMDFEIPSRGVVLINLENGQPITIQKENAFILGRTSAEIITREPLVDLTQFGALELGISRVHARSSILRLDIKSWILKAATAPGSKTND